MNEFELFLDLDREIEGRLSDPVAALIEEGPELFDDFPDLAHFANEAWVAIDRFVSAYHDRLHEAEWMVDAR